MNRVRKWIRFRGILRYSLPVREENSLGKLLGFLIKRRK